MAKVINVSFPRGTEPIYKAVKHGKPLGVPLATHARNLFKIATDSTCSTHNSRKK